MRIALAGVMTAVAVVAQGQVFSTSFQNGIDGYNGTFDRQISERDNGSDEVDLNTVAAHFLDGFSTGGSPDRQTLIRFDGIFGNGPGQVPVGATILSADLTLTTSLSGSAQSSGPWGVAGLTNPFDSNTSYFVDFFSSTDFGSRGAWWQDGSATRPVNGYGFQVPGGSDSTSVTSLVQSWSDGSPANGFVVQAGISDTITQNANTSDGWSVRTTGYPFPESRPKLDVTYTTAPTQTNVFQRGLNGYSGDTQAFVRSGGNALIADTDNPDDPELTEDGALLDQAFLDGRFFTNTNGDTSSPDDFTLVQFNDVFGDGPGQAPADEFVTKAFLVLTTGDQSGSAQTSGPWSAYKMLRDWDTTTLHSEFGAENGLQVLDGDITPAQDTLDGFIRGSEVWFDVTGYLEGVRLGADDFGIAVVADGTADGWQIHANGSFEQAARPRLVVTSSQSAAPVVNVSNAGDFNDDGVVNAADYTVWRDNLDAPLDFNTINNAGDGIDGVTLADYQVWVENFGNVYGAGFATPEPSALVVALTLAVGAASRRR